MNTASSIQELTDTTEMNLTSMTVEAVRSPTALADTGSNETFYNCCSRSFMPEITAAGFRPQVPMRARRNHRQIGRTSHNFVTHSVEPSFQGIGNPFEVDSLVASTDLNSYNWQRSLELRAFLEREKQ